MTSQDEWQLPFSIISGSLAIFFNVLLGYIILTTKSNYIGKYKWLLFVYTCTATLYGTGQVLVAGEFMKIEDAYMFYDSHRILPIWAGLVVLIVFVVLYVVTIVILTLSFIYRYLAVCNYEGLAVFVRFWVVTLLLSIVIISVEAFALTYTLRPTPYSHEIFQIPFYNATGLQITEVAYMPVIFIIRGQVNYELTVTVVLFLSLGVACGSLMVTLSFKIWRVLKSHTEESATLAQHQKRIFVLLLFQLTLPLIFQVIPLQITIVSVYLHLPSEGYVRRFGCMLSVAQVIDPLLMFYFIRPYHEALFQKLCGSRATVAPPSLSITVPGVVSSPAN